MSRDSASQGFQRGREAALAGQPQPQPAKDLATGDEGYVEFWLHGVPAGYQQGERERRIRETAAA